MNQMLNRKLAATLLFASMTVLSSVAARAEITDLADIPLANAPSDAVLPNLMYILDDSGSMTWDYMPDNVYNAPNCKVCTSSSTSSCVSGAVKCQDDADSVVTGSGEPPQFSNDFNQIYYNPDITYDPGLTSTGVSLGNQTPTAAKQDAYLNASTYDLVNTYPEIYYCNTSFPTTAQLSNTTVCKRNGIDNVQSGLNNYFLLFSNNVTTGTPLGGYPVSTGTSSTSFRNQIVQRTGHPYYFTISPHEYCSDTNLVNCALANANGSAPTGYSIPAPIRYCTSPTNTASTAAVSDAANVASPKCRKKYDPSNYQYPRYGRFRRVDIVPTTATYPLRSTSKRHDCVSTTSCTYAEELQNFANWFSYYRFRLAMMKTASGRAFLSIDDRYRVGFITINPVTSGSSVSTSKYLPIATFDAGQRASFYTKLYAQSNNGSTPLRQALARVGRHYAGITTGINAGMSTDPVQYSCQQNFALLTSDGYWNDSDSDAKKLDNTQVGNQDNVPSSTPPIYVSRATGTLDGLGTTYTSLQPTTIVEQTLCSANSSTAFTSGTQTTCGCAAGQKRIKQRTINQTTTTTGTDDVQQSSNTSTGSVTFQDITSCDSNVDTAVTPVTVVEQQIVVGTATSTFATINGVTANANKAGTCAAGQKRVIQRTTTYNSTVVTTDGTAAAPTFSGTTYAFVQVGSCVAPQVTTTTTPVTETAQNVCSRNNNSTFAAGTNGNTSQQACTCGTSGTPTAVKQRVLTYNKTVVTTDGVAAAPTYSAGSSNITTAVACSTTAKTAAATTIVNGAPGIVTTGGPTPVASATSTTNGSTTTTNNGGTTHTIADITINPNPTVTPGVIATTNVPGGTPNTLADVAMYYYKTDLRTSGALATPNVRTSDKDPNPEQHMVTYTLGLGLTGLMDYDPQYETATTGDFAKIKSGSSGCSWTTGTCNWPAPASGQATTLDDLWHAAVNGRGTYYSASDPNTLADGLGSALAALKVAKAAASASATSSPNITKTDNFIYSSTFRTAKWDGQIVAQRLDTTTGAILPGTPPGTPVWAAQGLLDSRVAAASDTRTIYTFSPATGNKLKTFVWGNLTSTEQAIFANKCPALSQCALLSAVDQATVNDGQNMVNYLRGQSQYASGTSNLYRVRDHALGDSVNATPIFVRAPTFTFNDAVTPTYATFKSANTATFDSSGNVVSPGRQSVLYVAANDGMLHAFNGDTGEELWAYVPRIVYPLLPGLASENWDVRHQFIVDGSPQVMDVFDSGANAWKTILIAGLNKGGRGYYALDITDPANPKGLWEACSDSSVCSISDNDFGDSYGYPVITKRPTDGKWVALVTSGLNNVSPGTGRGYLFVLNALTGAILQKIDTGAGDTTTPSGFSKISAFANNYTVDNTVLYVYGGDLLGNLWRFDMSTATPTVLKLAMLKDSTGRPQSITTRPELSIISGSKVVYVGTGRFLGGNDLYDPATLSPALPWAYQQSFYAIKDRNIALGNIRTSSPGLVQQTISGTAGGVSRTTSSNPVDWTTKDGWYVDFNPANDSPGERVNLDPQLILGTLLVATSVPNNGVCSPGGGDSWFYQFNFKTGTFITSAPFSVVAQKTVGAMIVGIVVVVLPNGKVVAEKTDSTGDQQPVAVNLGGAGGSGKRVSWREMVQ